MKLVDYADRLGLELLTLERLVGPEGVLESNAGSATMHSLLILE